MKHGKMLLYSRNGRIFNDLIFIQELKSVRSKWKSRVADERDVSVHTRKERLPVYLSHRAIIWCVLIFIYTISVTSYIHLLGRIAATPDNSASDASETPRSSHLQHYPHAPLPLQSHALLQHRILLSSCMYLVCRFRVHSLRQMRWLETSDMVVWLSIHG